LEELGIKNYVVQLQNWEFAFAPFPQLARAVFVAGRARIFNQYGSRSEFEYTAWSSQSIQTAS
jgi:hypothetical protein